MFSQLLSKVSKKSIRVRFTVKDGQIHLKTPSTSWSIDEYKKVASTIHSVVSREIMQSHNFTASVNVTL
jgi:hypothetical protein